MKPYDDDHYLQWHHQFHSLIADFLDTEGNTVESLRDEFDQAVEASEPEAELHVERPKK